MASLILAIIGTVLTLIGMSSIFLRWIQWISIIVLAVGVVLGIIGVIKKQGGLAIAGLVVSIIFLALDLFA